MNNKYLEYIIICLSIVIACAAIGLSVRYIVVANGWDDFSANAIFWIITGLGILVYCILTLIFQGLLDKTVELFFKSKQVKEELKTPRLSLDEIRSEKQKQGDQQKAEKLNRATLYTQETFAPYISDVDMELLCKYIEMYAKGNDLESITIQSIRVKKLTTTDICHFGWNLWNHFNVPDQWGISRFLKVVFAENLEDVELRTIKKKLKIFEPNSTIQIQKSLNKTDNTK